MNKTELLDECKIENTSEGTANKTSAISSKRNGLSDLKYNILSQEVFKKLPHNVIVTVDILLNDHWTDLVCGVDDNQSTKPSDLKKKFDELKNK